MAQVRKDPSGNLQIWTGTSWETIPNISVSDLSYYDASTYKRPMSMGDYEAPDSAVNYNNAWNFKDAATAAKYGNLSNMSTVSDNWLQEGVTPDSWQLTLKNADKTGAQVVYKKEGDYWVPTYQGDTAFDTNANGTNGTLRGLGTVAAAAAAGGLLSGAEGAAGSAAGPGTMTTYGILDTSLALPGTAFTPGIAAAGGDVLNAYGYLDTSAALPGTSFVDPFTGLPYNLASPGYPNGSQEPVTPDLKDPSQWPQTPPAAPPGDGGIQEPTNQVPTPSGPSLPDWLKDPNLLKLGAGIIGAVAGGAGGSSGGSGSGLTAAPAVQMPTMYGSGGGSGGRVGGQNWGLLGGTETERRMRQQYLPGLLGIGPWSV